MKLYKVLLVDAISETLCYHRFRSIAGRFHLSITLIFSSVLHVGVDGVQEHLHAVQAHLPCVA